MNSVTGGRRMRQSSGFSKSSPTTTSQPSCGKTAATIFRLPVGNWQKWDRESQKPEARSQKPEARSQKPEARSQKPEARSQKPEARSQKPEARIEPSERSHSGFWLLGFWLPSLVRFLEPLKHGIRDALVGNPLRCAAGKGNDLNA